MNTDPKPTPEFLRLTEANARLARTAAELLDRHGYTYMGKVLMGWSDFGIGIESSKVTKPKTPADFGINTPTSIVTKD